MKGVSRPARVVLALIALLGAGLAGAALAGAAPRPMQVFIAGDSTAAEYGPERYPQLGWGMVLKCAFGPDVVVRNYAKGGRSTKSFVTQGFFAQIEREIGKGDTLLIQFGHNDSKLDDPIRYTDAAGDYKAWLVRYIEIARSKGAQPVLIMPVTRRKFENGVLVDTHSDYAKAMREVAAESRTPLVDLTADSMRWISGLGDQASRQFYLVYTPEDRISRFPDGHEDNTHFSEIGARRVAELVAARLAKLKLPVSKRIRTSRPGLTRDIPLGGPSCSEPFTATPTQLVAFPGAEGAGRYAVGGRGGAVLKVTTLADAGPGSLRAAVDAKGPRTILFDVSGTIALDSPLRIEHGQVTLAGQSAPGDGITLKNFPLIVSADDVIVRYIRVRLGDERRSESDAIWIKRGRRVILDHVSASWSVDETLSARSSSADPADGVYDLTVQWSLIGESLNGSLHVKGEHGYGSLIAAGFGSRISFHHNLWAHHSGRNPRPGNPQPADRDRVGGFMDFRSNVFYDWGGGHAGYNADTGKKASLVQYNFVDNSYVRGPASTGAIAFKESNELAKAWFAGNTMDGMLPEDPWSLVAGKKGREYRLDAPVDVAPVTPESASLAFRRVLNEAGASLARDAVDRRIVLSVHDRSGGLINSQKDVGGWPALASAPVAPDSDGDGMPDARERARGLNPNKPDGRNRVDGSGYTNLENYLNDLVPARTLTAAADSAPGLIHVTATGVSYPTLQGAIDALPAQGGEITLSPGVYREKLTIDKPNVRLQGVGARPQEVVIAWGDGAVNVGGTFKSATLNVSGDGFRADNLTIQNDYSLRSTQPSQAVALSITGDRAVITRVRMLGAQDTLYAASRKCEGAACRVSRQYFRDCYIEGHVDFIFGDSKAFFDRCEIHVIPNKEILITAHSRTGADQDKAYVFDHCTITADSNARNVYFGRPWRDYAAVIFMNTHVDADLRPEGWREWHPGETKRLLTAYYAEYRSTGRGADTSAREPHSHQLSDAEAAKWSIKSFLAGEDGWAPERVR